MTYQAFVKQIKKIRNYTSMDGKMYPITDQKGNLAATASGLLRDAVVDTNKLNTGSEVKHHRDAQEILCSYIAARAYMFIKMANHVGHENIEDDVISRVCSETFADIKKGKLVDHRLISHISTLVRSRTTDIHRREGGRHPAPANFDDFHVAVKNGLSDIVELNKFYGDAITCLLIKGKLTQQDADMICHYWGLGDYEKIKTWREIADKLNIPREKINSMRKKPEQIFMRYCYDHLKDSYRDYLNALVPQTEVSVKYEKD